MNVYYFFFNMNIQLHGKQQLLSNRYSDVQHPTSKQLHTGGNNFFLQHVQEDILIFLICPTNFVSQSNKSKLFFLISASSKLFFQKLAPPLQCNGASLRTIKTKIMRSLE